MKVLENEEQKRCRRLLLQNTFRSIFERRIQKAFPEKKKRKTVSSETKTNRMSNNRKRIISEMSPKFQGHCCPIGGMVKSFNYYSRNKFWKVCSWHVRVKLECARPAHPVAGQPSPLSILFSTMLPGTLSKIYTSQAVIISEARHKSRKRFVSYRYRHLNTAHSHTCRTPLALVEFRRHHKVLRKIAKISSGKPKRTSQS